jgi:hypothetical protein
LRNAHNCVTVFSMDDEDKKKLDRVLELAEENNKYIRKVRSTQKTNQMVKAIYWTVIIVFMLGGFIYLKPYFKTLSGLYSGVNNADGGFQFSTTKQLQALINEFKDDMK